MDPRLRPQGARLTTPEAPLRLLLFDTTAGALTTSWRAGALLYAALGRLDAWHGAARWEDGLDWLAKVGNGRKISQIQYWGHGRAGSVLLDRVPLGTADLAGPHAPRLAAIRARLTPDALWWFRTCSTFRGPEGHAFARAWTRYFGCRAAGHTRVIGPLQGGLHSLAPGADPAWSLSEGLSTTRRPDWLVLHPHTITCLGGRLPPGW